MTATQIAILGGAIFGLGITLVLARLLPARVDPRWALDQLDPETAASRGRAIANPSTTPTSSEDRLGLIVLRRAPIALVDRIPVHDLAILRIPVYQHFGQKALLACIGLIGPGLFALAAAVAGRPLPFAIPAAVGLLLGVMLWFAPDGDVKKKAAQARREFVHAVTVYLDLVALQRLAGDGPTQALKVAATSADAWEFVRIHETLIQADLAGVSPWDALKALGDHLAVPELTDVAEIMRLSSQEGASVYEQLRARAGSLRSAQLADEQSAANAAVERLNMPIACLFIVFATFLGAPAFVRILG